MNIVTFTVLYLIKSQQCYNLFFIWYKKILFTMGMTKEKKTLRQKDLCLVV